MVAGKEHKRARKGARTPGGRQDGHGAPAQKPRGPWLKGALAAIAVALAAWYLAAGPGVPPVLRPFPSAPLKALPQFGGAHAEGLLWGTYRPGYYFGMRMRQPQSLLVGAMWTDPQRQDPLGNIRHEAQQRDGLAKYGWLQHDGERYGLQELWDEQFNISTAWAKRLCDECGPGGDWGVRLAFEQRARPEDAEEEGDEEGEPERPAAVSLFVYVAAEDGGALHLDPDAVAAALQGAAAAPAPQPAISGRMPPLSAWQLHLRRADSSASRVQVSYLGLATPHMHNLTEAVRQSLVASMRQQHAAGQRQYQLILPDVVQPGANVAVLQLTALLPLAVDLSFLAGLDATSAHQQQVAERLDCVGGAGLQRLLAQGAAAFEQRFAATFPALAAAGTGSSVPPGTAAVARAALSNMLGGLGYFYGHSLVRLRQPRQRGSAAAETTARLWDTALYSAVPSRSFFPRGFLWDEGFHQLLIRQWSQPLSREVLAHWFDLMNAQGWIAREQILGEEARARVPSEFVRQSPDAANPPTFFLVLSDMSHRVAAAAQAQQWSDADLADAELLKTAWPRLRAWYAWFNSTQAGPVPGAYRWRGREVGGSRELNPKTLTSGLDDAPRASHPSDEERHVDLRCWMALATRALATIGSNLGLPHKEVRPFLSAAAWLEDFDTLNALHLDPDSGEYRDWGAHTEDVELRHRVRTLPDGRQVAEPDMSRAETGAPPRPQLVPQYGYVSLFPLLMRLIPPASPVLGRQLELLRDPHHLWTDYGLRSLSRSASLYGAHNTEHDPPYWRGAVWVNVNYLAVQALRHYGATPGPHAAAAEALHQELRANLLRTIAGQYEATGYLWEQYDDAMGKGKGSHPFTGWTALFALLANDS